MPSTVIRRHPLERLSTRAALALGLGVTLGLWLFTGYTFTKRIEDVERLSTGIAARYMRAQQQLATIRSQVLLSSVRVRDALLDPSALDAHRAQIDAIHQTIVEALDAYEPMLGSPNEQGQVVRLREEVNRFNETSLAVLDDATRHLPISVRDVLNRHLAPRREAAVNISEEIQTLNRLAFIRQQADIAEIHRVAARQSWRWLGWALASSIAVLLLATIYSVRLEGHLRAQMERGARTSRELHDATIKLMSAQEDDRRMIARELDDEVGQVLTAIKVELSLAQRELGQRGLPAQPVAEAQDLADGALRTVRDLSRLLHPSALDDLGLAAAIDASLRGLARRHDIKVDLSQNGLSDRLPRETEVAAYRIVQEALTNVARHSHAAHCRVRLDRLPAMLKVEIEDDGSGFDVAAAVGEQRRGLGLISIRERIAHVGGTLSVRSSPGRGTRLSAELPAGIVGG